MADRKRGGWRGLLDVLKQTTAEWSGDRSPQIAAALAYYILFSVAPLLVLATALLGFVYGRQRATGRLFAEMSRFVGPQIAGALQLILAAASRPRSGVVATVLSTIVLIVGATGAFTSVQSALNQIWGVEPRPGRGIAGVIVDRLPAFLLLAAVGAVLVASLAVTTVLAGVTSFLGGGAVLAEVVDFIAFIVVLTLLFSLVYKVLPDARIAWRDVWSGALVTAMLFAVGQLLIGLYLSYSTVGTVYGAAGSLVALLVWLNYSGQAFLFGAELTQVVAARKGSRIEPSSRARRVQAPCGPPVESEHAGEGGRPGGLHADRGGSGAGVRPAPR